MELVQISILKKLLMNKFYDKSQVAYLAKQKIKKNCIALYGIKNAVQKLPKEGINWNCFTLAQSEEVKGENQKSIKY